MRPGLLAMLASAAALMLGASVARAQIPLPPTATPPGVVRIAGPVQMARLANAWAAGFQADNPGVRVELDLRGSDVAMAQLYTGQVDIALLGREAAEMEAKAFEWIYRYPPAMRPVASGSLATPGQAPAIAVLVHRNNPLASLTMDQLRMLFGHVTGAAGAETVPLVWGDFGLDGEWADRAITLYAPESESGTGRFFRARVLNGANALRWDLLTEFDEPVSHAVVEQTAGHRIAEAVAKDPGGLGLAHLDAAPGVRAVPLAEQPGPPIHATALSVSRGDYPLARRVIAYFNDPPQAPVDPETEAFLTYLRTEEAAVVVAETGDYLGLVDGF